MLLLKAKIDEDRQHGNGIMYGGGHKENPAFFSHLVGQVDRDPSAKIEPHYAVFFVETDFGNHMSLTWSELTNMFEVIGVRDYGEWKRDRDHLRSQPSLIDAKDEFTDFRPRG